LAKGSCYIGWTRAPVLSHLIFYCLACCKDSFLAKMRFCTLQEGKVAGVNNELWTEPCKLVRKGEKGKEMRRSQKVNGEQAQPIFLAFSFEFFGFSSCYCCSSPCCLSKLPFQACCNEKQTFPFHTQLGLCIRFGLWSPVSMFHVLLAAGLNRRTRGVYEIKMHSAEKLVFSFLTNFE